MGQQPVKSSSVLATVNAVLWSFLGIRSRNELKNDVARVTPLHLMVVGIGLTFAFVVVLMLLVRWIVQ